MYESFFHFSRRPFSAVPDPDMYFPASSMEQARLTLTRCIDRSAGPGLLIAPAGLGKTLLCQVLAQKFAKRFAVALLANSRLSTPRALLQSILFELGLPFRDMGEGELRLSLIDHVAPNKGGVDGMLLIVDEAHMLSPRLLEEIRMITNLVRDGQLRVRVVLSGGSRLEERFACTQLESFNQRIAARCYLEPLSYNESCAYIQAQLAAAGAAPDSIFTEDALTAIHRAGDGIPRLINQVADHALVLAAAGGQPCIDAAGINEAWSDLQQLPAVVGASSAAVGDAAPGGVVEFGSLSDEEDTLPAATSEVSAVEVGESLDPSERLDHIQRQVAAAQQDDLARQPKPARKTDQFDPLESTVPEVELVFDEADDPFNETFEEEVTIAIRAEPFRKNPPAQEAARSERLRPEPTADVGETCEASAAPPAGQVELREQDLLVDFHPTIPEAFAAAADPDLPQADLPQQVVEPHAVDEPWPAEASDPPQLAVVAGPDQPDRESDEAAAAQSSTEMADNDEQTLAAQHPLEDNETGISDYPERDVNDRLNYVEATVAMADGPFVAEQEATAVTVIPLSLWTDSVNDALPADDRDIIVVDDRQAAQPAARTRPARTRRHDYRRLFAQLRQHEA